MHPKTWNLCKANSKAQRNKELKDSTTQTKLTNQTIITLKERGQNFSSRKNPTRSVGNSNRQH